jgi:hypothetical protein
MGWSTRRSAPVTSQPWASHRPGVMGQPNRQGRHGVQGSVVQRDRRTPPQAGQARRIRPTGALVLPALPHGHEPRHEAERRQMRRDESTRLQRQYGRRAIRWRRRRRLLPRSSQTRASPRAGRDEQPLRRNYPTTSRLDETVGPLGLRGRAGGSSLPLTQRLRSPDTLDGGTHCRHSTVPEPRPS